MLIVFDLQAAAVRLPTDITPAGAYALALAQAVAQHAAAREPEDGALPFLRVVLLLPSSITEAVIRIRRQLDGLQGRAVQLQVWHPMPSTTSWHRQANATIYQQLMGRLGADVLVFSDSCGTGGHALAGAPDWLPAGSRGLFLVGQGTAMNALPGDASAWAQALKDRHAALCAPANEIDGITANNVLALPAPIDRSNFESMARAADAFLNILKGFDTEGGVPRNVSVETTAARRPRLAYVSPLPPARTGIADYSAELVDALAAHYDIDLIVDGPGGTDADRAQVASSPAGVVRSVEWFAQHGDEFDRVLYHFGNSPFHGHMPALCERFPGAVVLHDFFLGDLLWACEFNEHRDQWQQAYYRSHGYGALGAALQDGNLRTVLARYPVNFQFLRHSRGVIVHSEGARELAAQWLPPVLAGRFRCVPLLRIPILGEDRVARRRAAREALGALSDRFMICCFGMVGEAKANLDILEAWLRMDESTGGNTELVFVGANEDGEYGRKLTAAIAAAGDAVDRIRITGWVGAQDYRRYLEAADAAVQLRTIDRGETSAAVLDCMNHGLPTVVNDSGSMAELPADAVYKLAAGWTVADVARALIELYDDPAGRKAMAGRAASLVHVRHDPKACAVAYRNALEDDFYRHAAGTWQAAVGQLAWLPGTVTQDIETLAVLSNAVAASLPSILSAKQLLVDVTAICRSDLRTGIQRVVRALLVELIASPPAGYRIEPVYFCDRIGSWHLRYARNYTLGLLDARANDGAFEDEIVEVRSGDRFLGLDFSSGYIVEAARLRFFETWKRSGVASHFVVYDLLPVLRPEVFPQEASPIHEQWLRAILAASDSVVCISQAVADELHEWKQLHAPDSEAKINAFHLGADVDASAPTRGMPDDAAEILNELRSRPTFLTVGTVEPRKGIAQVLAAFESLWRHGIDVNLVLVGKPGWQVDMLVEALRSHPERGLRLFWLAGISDEYLEKIYSQATCLLAASEAEGFGLPLIEAAKKGLPIIARDIPVFREVTEQNAFFFSGASAWSLSEAIKSWLLLHREGKAPSSKGIKWLSWKQSTQALVEKIFKS